MEVCSKKQKLYVLGIVLILIVTGSLLSKRSKPFGENTLQPLLVREMYASGSMLERSKTFAARFESYMETAAIPNIREDSTGQDTAIITDPKSDLTLLQEFPEQDIYIWGYNDVEEPGYGLIFDVGDTPHIDSFPYFYESNHGIPPDFILSADGKTIFCICHTGFGTGFSVSELILFQLEDFQIEPYYLNIDELSDRLNDTIQVVYDADMDAVTVSAGGSDPKSYFQNSMYRLVLNTESHLQEAVQGAPEMSFFSHLTVEEKQRTARDVLCFMYCVNPAHVLAHLPNARKELDNWMASIG